MSLRLVLILLAFLALLLSITISHPESNYSDVYVETIPLALDGYWMEETKEPQKKINIKIQYYESKSDLRTSYVGDVPYGKQVMAYAQFNNETCVIHIVDPRVDYEPEIWGHEFLHCLLGNWHPTQGK